MKDCLSEEQIRDGEDCVGRTRVFSCKIDFFPFALFSYAFPLRIVVAVVALAHLYSRLLKTALGGG